MSSLNSIATSGLAAAQLRLDASASNVANLNTPGYRARQVAQQATPGGGVAASVQRADAEGVSLEKEIVDQLAAKQAFLANLQTLRTGDAVLGALLDVRA
ncbi:MAG: flagellar basal body protein [Burkholderiaceae bacterium]|jgi:flagellar hook-associated protein FlgK|nr:flagellar basal body rod protein [Burkholderiaceae bacterium]MCO5104487.1 flagellar basal body protein [Burkholderiaceae bacterium]